MSSSVTTVDTDPITFTQFSLNPSNIVTAVSPGAGVAHFAGSTQVVTSSAVVEADQTLADNTTNNVSTSKHGYVPKAPNDATKFLDGTGAFSSPTGASVATPNTFANLPATCTPSGANAIFYATDGPYVSICTTTNTYSHFMSGFGKMFSPQVGDYTAINGTNATAVNTFGPLDIASTTSSGGAWNFHCWMKAVPSAPYTFRGLVSVGGTGPQSQIVRAGLALAEAGATPKLVTYEVLYGSGDYYFNSDNLTNPTTISGANFGATNAKVGGVGNFVYMGLSDDSTLRHFETSLDGQNWFDVASQSNTNFATPTQIGFCLQNDTANQPGFLRVYSIQ